MQNKLYNLSVQSETDKYLTVILHVDETELIKRNSVFAEKMSRYNPSLFNKISNSIYYLHGNVYVFHVSDTIKRKNKLGVDIEESRKSDRKSLITFGFSNNSAENIHRYDFGSKMVYDVNPKDIRKSKDSEFLSSDNITTDDISQAKKICTIEEIDLFKSKGIKTLVINDHESIASGVAACQYEVELFFNTNHEAYIKDTVDQLRNSVEFMDKYLNFITTGGFYDHKKQRFSEGYTKGVLSGLGIPIEDLGFKVNNIKTNNIMKSDFGRVSSNFLRAKSILGEKTSENIHKKIIFSLLPIKTSPEKILNLITRCRSLIERCIKKYDLYSKKSFNYKIVLNKKKLERVRQVFQTSDVYHIQNKDGLSYNLFLEEPSSDIKITKHKLQNRMTSELGKFTRAGRFTEYITPVSINIGGKKISTKRHYTDMNPADAKRIRLIKAGIAQEKRTNNRYTSKTKATRVGARLSQQFNVSIGNPVLSSLDKKTDGVDSIYVDAKEYLGNHSWYSYGSRPVNFLQFFRKLNSRQEIRNFRIYSEILPQKYLLNRNEISTIKDLDSSPASRFTLASRNKMSQLPPLPPQIQKLKSMTNLKGDILKNHNTREIIEETFKNIQVLYSLKGFAKDDQGGFIMNAPIYEKLRESDMNDNRNLLVKSEQWTNPTIGFYGDVYNPPMLGTLMIVQNSRAIPGGIDDAETAPSMEPAEPSLDAVVDPSREDQPAEDAVEINSLLAKHTTSNVITQDPNKAAILDLLNQVDQTPTGGTSGGTSGGY